MIKKDNSIEKTVSNKIYYMYFILSFMILGLHSAYMELFENCKIPTVINDYFRIFWNMAVPTFFFVSALLFYRNCQNKKYFDVIKNKFKTLIIPYLLWNIICGPLKEFKDYLSQGFFNHYSIFEVIENILLSKWDPVLWFIRVLFIYFLLYPIIFKIVKNQKICIGFITVNLFINIYLGPETGYSSVRYWLPIYMLGAYLSYWYSEFMFLTKKYSKTSIILAFACQSFLIFMANYSILNLYLCRMISPLLFWVIFDAFKINVEPKWILKQSFYFYCSQMIFSVFAQKIYIAILGRGCISAVFANIGIPLILFILLSVSAKILYRYFNPVWKILTGNR